MIVSVGRPCSSLPITSNIRGARSRAGAIMVVSHAMGDEVHLVALVRIVNDRGAEAGSLRWKKMTCVPFATCRPTSSRNLRMRPPWPGARTCRCAQRVLGGALSHKLTSWPGLSPQVGFTRLAALDNAQLG